MRELRLTDTRDGSTRTVRQFDASSTADALIHLERQIYYSISNKLDFNELTESSRPIAGSTITTASSTMTSFPPNPSSMLETSFTEDDFLRFNQIPTHVISTFRQCYQPICESMLELISQVHKTKEHFGIDGPITVHCKYVLFTLSLLFCIIFSLTSVTDYQEDNTKSFDYVSGESK